MKFWQWITLSLFLITAAEPAIAQQHPTLVSVNAAGAGSANNRSGDFGVYRLTPDGRYVIFQSEATDLLAPSNEAGFNIFRRDLQTGTTTLVSVKLPNLSPGGVTRFGLISDNGRYVAFTSFARNIVANDTNTSPDVFIRDMELGETRLVSVNAAGTESGALGGSELIDMSPDGRFVVFQSQATNLTAQPDVNGFGQDIYVRDTVTNVTKLVSINMAGAATGNGTSGGGSITSDGRYIVFSSESSDLVPNDTATRDVFLRDLQAGTTIRISNNAAGTGGGNNSSDVPFIDRGGRIVVFQTNATNLSTLPDTNDLTDIIIYDVQSGTKRLITINAAGAAAGAPLDFAFNRRGVTYKISADARFVVFSSQSRDLVTNDTNSDGDDIFRYEVATQKNTLVSVNLAGTSGSISSSFSPSVSADGRFVAFHSLANDLVAVPDEPSGGTNDVFVRDMQTGHTVLASINAAGTRTANGFSFEPLLSADGNRLVFFSRAPDLVANDLNNGEDVFVFTRNPGTGLSLVLEDDGLHALALDSVFQARGPFTLAPRVEFGSDGRTRISLFVSKLNLQPGETESSLTVTATDGQGTVHPVSVDHLAPLAGADDITQVIVKLPQVNAPAELLFKISLRNATTNGGRVKLVTP